MARDNKVITQFYLPPTNKPCLPLLPSCRASPPFGWYSFAHTHGGLARLSWPGWLICTEIGFRHRELNPRPVTHPSTNRARRRVTSLIETNVLLLRQTANVIAVAVFVRVRWILSITKRQQTFMNIHFSCRLTSICGHIQSEKNCLEKTLSP